MPVASPFFSFAACLNFLEIEWGSVNGQFIEDGELLGL